ncbi:hypothetical protein ACFE04_029720 [Oxalis oulophora]
MIHGGTSFNIIPDSATISGTFRAFNKKSFLALRERIKEVIKAQSVVHRCSADVDFAGTNHESIPPTVNDEGVYEHASMTTSMFLLQNRVVSSMTTSLFLLQNRVVRFDPRRRLHVVATSSVWSSMDFLENEGTQDMRFLDSPLIAPVVMPEDDAHDR